MASMEKYKKISLYENDFFSKGAFEAGTPGLLQK
jgi:hypothetical protein